MKILLVGDDGPGALLRSLLPGLADGHEVCTLNPLDAPLALQRGPAPLRNRLARRHASERFTAAVADLSPDAVVVVKGRGIESEAVAAVRRRGAKVIVYYPDNPLWRRWDDAGMLGRLTEADVVVSWSQRIAGALHGTVRRVEVLPFGYDDRWFQPAHDARVGVAFLGSWYARRGRFVDALGGLPLRIHGSEWPKMNGRTAAAPAYERAAGQVLGQALIGINVLHPANAGGHNMRTREIAACGALELTEPGTDGTPLRDGDGCVWFRTPEELRARAEYFLAHPDEAAAIAARGRELILADTYVARGRALAELAAGA